MDSWSRMRKKPFFRPGQGANGRFRPYDEVMPELCSELQRIHQDTQQNPSVLVSPEKHEVGLTGDALLQHRISTLEKNMTSAHPYLARLAVHKSRELGDSNRIDALLSLEFILPIEADESRH